MKFKFISVVGFLLLASLAYSADITFSTSGSIGGGDSYDTVYLENDGTIVDMAGGQIRKLWLRDNSIFNMSGGNITGGIDAVGASYFDMSDGTINMGSTLVLYGNGGCFSGGSVTAYGLKTGGYSKVKIDGGVLSFGTFDTYGDITINGGVMDVDSFSANSNNINIRGGIVTITNTFTAVYDKSIVNIYGGDLTIHDIVMSRSATINIYSENYNYNINNKTLTGYLVDGNKFSIGGVDQLEYGRFNMIPEPVTFLLLGLGGLLLRRRK